MDPLLPAPKGDLHADSATAAAPFLLLLHVPDSHFSALLKAKASPPFGRDSAALLGREVNNILGLARYTTTV